MHDERYRMHDHRRYQRFRPTWNDSLRRDTWQENDEKQKSPCLGATTRQALYLIAPKAPAEAIAVASRVHRASVERFTLCEQKKPMKERAVTYAW